MDRRTDGTENITSTANTGGNEEIVSLPDSFEDYSSSGNQDRKQCVYLHENQWELIHFYSLSVQGLV